MHRLRQALLDVFPALTELSLAMLWAKWVSLPSMVSTVTTILVLAKGIIGVSESYILQAAPSKGTSTTTGS